MPVMAAQSTQAAASAMDGRSAIIGRSDRRAGSHLSLAPPYAVGTCFVTCNGKTEITESVQIVLDPVFDVESDGNIRFL